MSSYRELYKSFMSGNLDEVAKELVRYGTIVKDKSFDVAYGFYKGSHRITTFSYVGHVWTIRKQNGNVARIELEH